MYRFSLIWKFILWNKNDSQYEFTKCFNVVLPFLLPNVHKSYNLTSVIISLILSQVFVITSVFISWYYVFLSCNDIYFFGWHFLFYVFDFLSYVEQKDKYVVFLFHKTYVRCKYTGIFTHYSSFITFLFIP